jgi:putative ABC transport system substrate-binding protein
VAHRFLIVELVQRLGLPAIYVLREQVEVGGLMSYSDDLENAYRLQAKQVAEILRGAKPAEMPYIQASRYELAINLKTAKALGLTIPPALLARADVVIE